MSGASADGTTADYSKGPSTRRAGFVNVRGIAAAFVVASVALLVVAELSVVVRVVVGSLETEQRTVTGHANHDWALLLVAIAAVPLAIGALRGARPDRRGRARRRVRDRPAQDARVRHAAGVDVV
jgi:hypothetical protein